MKVRIITGTVIEFKMVVKLENIQGESKIVKIETMDDLSIEVKKFGAGTVDTLGPTCIFKEGM